MFKIPAFYVIISSIIALILFVLVLIISPLFFKRLSVGSSNLKRCFPEKSFIWIVQQLLKHLYYFIRSFCDRFWLWHGNENWVKNSVIVHHLENWYEYEQSIILAPHFLGLDAASSRLCIEQRPMAALYSRQKKFDHWFYEGRMKYNKNTVLLERSGNISAILKALKEKRHLYYLPDMDLGEKGAVFVPFFHDVAATNTALFRLTKHLNLPVIPCICRMTYYGYEVFIKPRFTEFELQSDETQAMTVMNQWLAQTIQELAIPQYYWLHKRFKTKCKNVN